MSHATDKRFKSFLWSQTRKAAFAETRLSVDEAADAAHARPVSKPEPTAEVSQPPVSRAKGRLTPLEQATMRMSEFCAPPADATIPATAPGVIPVTADESPVTHQADWHLLHVHAQADAASQGTATHLGRLNVRKAM